MKKRQLGRTGVVVSEVGFGGWGLGGTMWLGVSEEEGRRAVETALEQGVTFFDTALAYGDGRSERAIGAVLRARPAVGRVTVATKIPPKDRLWPASPDSRLEDVFPADTVRTSTESSLRNLGRDVIDVQQFHVWQDAWLEQKEWARVRREMERLRDSGTVRFWGISINDHDPASALRALADPIFDTAQVIYNVYDRAPERDLFPLAKSRGLGIVVRVPFDEGALTGAVRADTAFPDGDWRHRYFRGDRRAEAERRASALAALLGDEAASLPDLALRFVLAAPEVSTVIPGMRRPEHVRANAAVSDGRRLSDGLLSRLREHAWDKNWYGD